MPTRSPKRTIIPWQCSPARWLPLLSQCGTYWTWSRITRTWSLWTCLSGWTVPSSRPHPACCPLSNKSSSWKCHPGPLSSAKTLRTTKATKSSLNFGAAAFYGKSFLEMDFVKDAKSDDTFEDKEKKGERSQESDIYCMGTKDAFHDYLKTTQLIILRLFLKKISARV